MKLLFKYLKTTRFSLEVSEESTIAEAELKVQQFMNDQLNIKINDIAFSLNGKTPLTLNSSDKLSTLLVKGDLVHLLPKKPSEDKKELPLPDPPKTFSEVQNGEIPIALLEGFKKYKPNTKSGLMNLLIHLNMLEKNFQMLGDEVPQWNSSHLTISYKVNNSFNFCLTIISMGIEKHVFGVHEKQEAAIEWRFKIDKYYAGSEADLKSIRNIEKFVIEVRNNITYPLEMVASSGDRVLKHCLANLPMEIIHRIAMYMSCKDILTLSSACKQMLTYLSDDILWRKMYRKAFTTKPQEAGPIDWKTAYQIEYQKLKRQKEEAAAAHERHRLIEESNFPQPRILPRLPTYPHDPLRPDFQPDPFGVRDPYRIDPRRDPDSMFYEDYPDMPNPLHVAPRRRRSRGPRIDFI